MIRVRVRHVQERVARGERPPGYAEDVARAATTVQGDFYLFTPQAYQRLAAKYGGRKGIAKVAHGAAGLTKAMLHINRADDAMIAHRRSVCAKCEFKGKILVNAVVACKLCGCAMAAKTVNADERCPIGKW